MVVTERWLSPRFVGKSNKEANMLYSVKQTAKRLGISRTHLYSLFKSGDLDMVKLGRRTMVERDAVHRLIESKRSSTRMG